MKERIRRVLITIAVMIGITVGFALLMGVVCGVGLLAEWLLNVFLSWVIQYVPRQVVGAVLLTLIAGGGGSAVFYITHRELWRGKPLKKKEGAG